MNPKWRGTKEVITAPLKAAVGDEVRRAMPSTTTPYESALVAKGALQVYGDIVRSTGVPTPFVLNFAMRYAVNASLATFLTQKAAEAGFETPAGRGLIEMAHRCEGRAERAMVALDAAIRAFGERAEPEDDLRVLVAEAAQPRDGDR